jgi:uncharacterized protein (DUF362 family)
MTPVALARCPAYEAKTVQESLDRALALLGGLEQFVRPGDRVIVKPNLLTAQPESKAATTHPQVVDALLSRLVDLGARPQVADSPAFGWAAHVAAACGIEPVARKYGVPVVDFTAPAPISSIRPEVRRHFVTDRSLLEADVVINVAKLKAHRQLGFTGATKNLYGCMPGKRKAYFHFERGNRDADFARLIASFAYSIPVHLNLLDAVIAMERDGPAGGDPKPVGALIAGTDPAAVDAVAAELIAVPEQNRLLLEACRELRLGSPRMDTIELRGATVPELAVADFIHPLLVGVRFSPGRLARSIWRNVLITRWGYDPHR